LACPPLAWLAQRTTSAKAALLPPQSINGVQGTVEKGLLAKLCALRVSVFGLPISIAEAQRTQSSAEGALSPPS
jgi:hypothetical protein